MGNKILHYRIKYQDSNVAIIKFDKNEISDFLLIAFQLSFFISSMINEVDTFSSVFLAILKSYNR